MIEQSESIANLAASFSKAQAAIEGAVKGKVNPAFKSKYADLASVWDACREALTDNGLSVVQSPGHLHEGRMEMTTMLLHASGEWMRGSLTIPLGKVDAQAYGSAVTYARRYALSAFVGVSPDDDDGAAATKAKPSPAPIGPRPAPPPENNAPHGRKIPAQATRDGDHKRINDMIAKADADELARLTDTFDEWTAEVPFQWLDALRDKLILAREELDGAASVAAEEAALDAEFRGTLGNAPQAMAGRRNDRAGS
jgi:hypothetical protein